MRRLLENQTPTQTATSFQEYNDSDEWSRVEEQPVYTVSMRAARGMEVKLTELVTFQHVSTGETKDTIRPDGETEFIFRDEWPSDNVLEFGLVQYRPCGEGM